MKYAILEVGGKELKLKLGTQEIIEIEKKLGGKSLLKILMEEQLLPLETALSILHASLKKFEHGYTIQKVYELYDEYVDEEGSFTDLTAKLLEVLQVSGFFSKEQVEKAKEQATAE